MHATQRTLAFRLNSVLNFRGVCFMTHLPVPIIRERCP